VAAGGAAGATWAGGVGAGAVGAGAEAAGAEEGVNVEGWVKVEGGVKIERDVEGEEGVKAEEGAGAAAEAEAEAEEVAVTKQALTAALRELAPACDESAVEAFAATAIMMGRTDKDTGGWEWDEGFGARLVSPAWVRRRIAAGAAGASAP